MADIATDETDERLEAPLSGEGGLFGTSPIPSEQSVPESPHLPLLHDVFGLVLLLGSIQPVWSLGSVFCYHGLWNDYKRQTQQSVVVTVATGGNPRLSYYANHLQTRQPSTSCAMNGKCIIFVLSFSSLYGFRLLYLHTGSPMAGIAHPIQWKTSPNHSEMVIIYQSNDKERSLAQVYLDKEENKPYRPPSVPNLCSLAIKVVEVVDQFHSKRVRHGSLRPDVIGIWNIDGQVQICIRDFSESRVLGEHNGSLDAGPASNEPLLNFPVGVHVHYIPPETILPGNPSKC